MFCEVAIDTFVGAESKLSIVEQTLRFQERNEPSVNHLFKNIPDAVKESYGTETVGPLTVFVRFWNGDY